MNGMTFFGKSWPIHALRTRNGIWIENKKPAVFVETLLTSIPRSSYRIPTGGDHHAGKVAGQGRGLVSRVFVEKSLSTLNPSMVVLGVSISLKIFFVLFWADLRLWDVGRRLMRGGFYFHHQPPPLHHSQSCGHSSQIVVWVFLIIWLFTQTSP